MKIQALASRYRLRFGELPDLLIEGDAAAHYWGRDPFDGRRVYGISENLMIPPEGTTDGHNTMQDTSILDAMRVDQQVPLSPLFVRDLSGRVIYIGFGPETRTNDDWGAYSPPAGIDGVIDPKDLNPFAPLCVFPRYCRDVQKMPGNDVLENVFLTKFRCLDMSFGYNGLLSGSLEPDEDGNVEEDPYVAASYAGANLYPYKLRLDTFYTDGYKLPQTQMLFARGPDMGVDVAEARRIGDKLLAEWHQRTTGLSYEAWLQAHVGKNEAQRFYELGCTIIPTFDACNGYHVVNRDFGLEDYWPGRAVEGLHEVMEIHPDKAPVGTILQVLAPGYITAQRIVKAQVIVSDGSQYRSPNGQDPVPLIPNMHLPHQRTIADWELTWLPTHPGHFEAPALWGWELNTGRFLQMSGPLWDPLHYYYASVDKVLAAFDAHLARRFERLPLVEVPEEMIDRFYPIVPMQGFDTFSEPEMKRRGQGRSTLRSSLKRVHTDVQTAGIGYHPLPPEFEFELDPFWFPELHPLNREQGICPESIEGLIAPLVESKVSVAQFVASVEGGIDAPWLRDTAKLAEPEPDAWKNYPFLARYLVESMEPMDVVKLCPSPFLSDPGDLLKVPVENWWRDDSGKQLDSPAALQQFIPNIADALWTMREKGAEVMKFRHMLYRLNLPLYMLGWWHGASLQDMEDMFLDWIAEEKPKTAEENPA